MGRKLHQILSLPVLLFLGTTLSMTEAVQRVSVDGTWETVNQENGPWIFSLRSNGNKLTGFVWEQGGLAGPSEIVDGQVEGTNLTFRYVGQSQTSRAAEFFPNWNTPPRGQRPPAPPQRVEITLKGVLRPDTIEFRSTVKDPRPNPPRIGGVLPALARRELGALGSLIAGTFTVRRATAAVAGRVSVDELSVPRPVFKLSFVNSDGKRFAPLNREVWNQPPPQTLMQNLGFPLGSAFDAVPRFYTNTLPGNPAEFVARLPVGEYKPELSGLPEGYVLKAIRSGSVDLTAASLRVGEGASPADLTIVLGVASDARWTRVSGTVKNTASRKAGVLQEQRPAQMGGQLGVVSSPPQAIVLASRSFSEFWIAPIGPDGRFEFARVLPGAYELRAFPDSPVTAALSLTVPVSGDLKIDLTVPDVIAVPCPMC